MKIQKFKNKITRTIAKRNSMILTLLIVSFPVSSFAADFPQAGDFQKGAKTWAENCGRCHNIRAANELRDDQWITTVFHMRIRAGLTGSEARDVLTFLQESNTSVKIPSLPKSTGSSTSNLSGKDVYNQTCIACHGANGTGNFPGVPDFSSKTGALAKSDDILINHILGGFQSPGSPMAMPPKGGNPDLNKKEIQKTLAYIRKQFNK